jgi:MFS family permease
VTSCCCGAGSRSARWGSAVTGLALPLTAVAVLRAATFQVGLLTSAATAAFALIALPAGALVDRRPKRRLMIGCDAARLLIIGSVPLAAPGWRVAAFPAGLAFYSFGGVVYNVAQVSTGRRSARPGCSAG